MSKAQDLAGSAAKKIVNFGLDGAGPYKSAIEVAEECLTHSRGDVEDAIRRSIRLHVRHAGTSGAVTGAGSIPLMPITIPGGLAGLYVTAARMTGSIAHLRGYDVHSEEVRTVVMVTLLGSSGATALKNIGIEIGTKAAYAQLKKLPGKALIEINKKVGFRLLTKAGETGVLNLKKLIPFVGIPIGASADYLACRAIAKYAMVNFPEVQPLAGKAAGPSIDYVIVGAGRKRALDLHIDGRRVTTATFDIDDEEGRLELISLDTEQDFRRQGYASRAVRHLFTAFPNLHIIASPDEQNSEEGELLIRSLRDEGLDLHRFGCYRGGSGCRCGLEDPSA